MQKQMTKKKLTNTEAELEKAYKKWEDAVNRFEISKHYLKKCEEELETAILENSKNILASENDKWKPMTVNL